MSSDISQAQNDKYCRVPLTRYLESSISQRQEVKGWLPGAGGGGGVLLFTGSRVAVLQDEKNSEMDSDDGSTTM